MKKPPPEKTAADDKKFDVVRYEDERGVKLLNEWLATLRDRRAQSKLERRVMLMSKGDFGQTRPVGQGVIESKIDEGPGYRLYYAHYGTTVVLLICGGDKRTQNKDIKLAQDYWAQWKERQKHEAQELRSK